jgi:hypothetical protein
VEVDFSYSVKISYESGFCSCCRKDGAHNPGQGVCNCAKAAILDRCESIAIDSGGFMRPARVWLVEQASEEAHKGPQLVPRKADPAQGPVPAIEAGDAHPIVTILMAGMIAFTGAVTFAGSIVIWLLVRNTGVNWMFQR